MNEDIITLRLEGLGYKAIAKKLGITRDRARDVCRRNGLGGVLATTRAQEEKVCACCGKTFIANHPNRKYCSDSCSDQANLERAKKAAQIKAQSKVPLDPVECPVCGKVFVPRNTKQKCCCKQCGNIYHDRLRRIRKKAQPHIGYCVCCGKEIDTRNGRKFCSHACGKAYRGIGRKYKLPKTERLKEAVAVDKTVKLHTLILRDNNVCQICGKPCDLYDYEVTASGAMLCGDRYPTIDHIFPCSKGGSHTWDNVQLACLKCNRDKRDNVEV